MNETDLGEKVVKWLEAQHWDVYQEVKFSGSGGRADIAAVRDGKLWIIECKTSLSFTVLEQASGWSSHFRSIAIPATRERSGRGVAYRIARDYLKIGVIEVRMEFSDVVYEFIPAPLMREYHREAKRLIGGLREEQKYYASAGTNGGGYYTPYRGTMDAVKRFIMHHPGCTLKEIMDDIGDKHHYASVSSARSCIRTALSNWETPWCEIKTGEDGRTFRYYVKHPLPIQG